jgi:hypothetical protein
MPPAERRQFQGIGRSQRKALISQTGARPNKRFASPLGPPCGNPYSVPGVDSWGGSSLPPPWKGSDDPKLLQAGPFLKSPPVSHVLAATEVAARLEITNPGASPDPASVGRRCLFGGRIGLFPSPLSLIRYIDRWGGNPKLVPPWEGSVGLHWRGSSFAFYNTDTGPWSWVTSAV